MIAQAVSEVAILAMLNFLGSEHSDRHGEISHAIAEASSVDPLFPQREDGAERTASILVSIAFHESRFHPNVIGDQGKSFGLFQIQPGTWKIDAKTLLLPRTAASVAIDLVRKSFAQCRKRPWQERLSWYAASATCETVSPTVLGKSIERMLLADKLFRRFFPERHDHVLPNGSTHAR